MSSRPLILITNDDGYLAPGLKSLVSYVKPFGDIIVVAPDTAQSGMSSAITVDKALRIMPRPDIEGARVFSVSGTPVDCVKLALHAIVPRKPDLLLSGINHGSNSGTAIIYSGTMGAVLEGCMVGIPSVGFSLLHHSIAADFTLASSYIADIVQRVLDNPLPHGVCLNVNIPAKIKPLGVKVCRAATGHWTEEYKKYDDPFGYPFFWLTGHFQNDEPQAHDTDEYWLDNGYISLVPVTPDQTLKAIIPEFSKIFEE